MTRSPEPPPTRGCKLPADETDCAPDRDTGHGCPAGHAHGGGHPPRHGPDARPAGAAPSRTGVPGGLRPQTGDPARRDQLQTVTRRHLAAGARATLSPSMRDLSVRSSAPTSGTEWPVQVACLGLLCVVSAWHGYGLRPDLGPVPGLCIARGCRSRVAEAEQDPAGQQRRGGPAGEHADACPRADGQAAQAGGGLDCQPRSHRR